MIWLRTALVLGLLGSAVASADAETVVLRGGSLYASPDAAALPDAVVVMTDGVISAVGKSGDVQVPADARVIDCSGKTIVAGFWNSHVHFTEPVWRNAGAAPAAPLTQHMQEMLTRWGFTTVWDLGSDPGDSLPLRQRIAKGEIAGPTILFAGNIFPKGGHPVYIPREVQLPEVATPEEATKWARDWLAIGEDGIKLFTGAFMGDKPVVNMDPAIAKGAVEVAHAQGKPVFAHPQNKVGVETVIASDVDVLAHTTPGERAYTDDQLARFKAHGTALIPTLSLFTTVVLDPNVTNRLIAATTNQLKQFSENGGTVLFGTDVGFTQIYDTTQEVELMHRALSERQVLAALTTNPATFFKAAKKGRVETGFDADLVVLDGDPVSDVRNLAKVNATIRAGHVIYQKP
ncbi:amidohydrolase family protein [Bradyrhizobium sp. CCBAU 51753]|uniref:amidohydrolase family protein n=1 Tax=Bradyrhizobium sp. CCBAU 51753 TaxID=1325100 RepID=UPI00188C6A0A|nr:amidohydrolase family protein [Bradyrhizobium sp. CCBAU 51753]QOZ26552.1 amidohydrolase [Bradyrhizobium sp. CCBAU 51753]